MSKMKLCKVCLKEVAKSAKVCPHCGARLKMGIIKKILITVVLVFAGLTIIGTLAPDDSSNTNSTTTKKVSTSKAKATTKKSNSTSTTSSASNSTSTSSVPFSKQENDFSSDTIQKLYSKSMNYLTLKSSLFSPDYYKLTLDQSDYIYYGDLKDNEPDGKGILLQRVENAVSRNLYAPIYIGYFKSGNFNGFGYKYTLASDNNMIQNIFSDFVDKFNEVGVTYKQYEGYFSDGKFDGKGESFQIDFGTALDISGASAQSLQNSTSSNDTFDKYFTDNNAAIQNLENNAVAANSSYMISKLPPLNVLLNSYGSYSNNKLNGAGKSYGKNNVVIYDGNFSNDEYDGKGKLYYNDGKLEYNGSFSKGKYDGTGTLYNEDGSVKYSGKWSDGDVK